jgi:hypothetical protein
MEYKNTQEGGAVRLSPSPMIHQHWLPLILKAAALEEPK